MTENALIVISIALFTIVFLVKAGTFAHLSRVLINQNGTSRLAVLLTRFFVALSVQSVFNFALYGMSAMDAWHLFPEPPQWVRLVVRFSAILWSIYVIFCAEEVVAAEKESEERHDVQH